MVSMRVSVSLCLSIANKAAPPTKWGKAKDFAKGARDASRGGMFGGTSRFASSSEKGTHCP